MNRKTLLKTLTCFTTIALAIGVSSSGVMAQETNDEKQTQATKSEKQTTKSSHTGEFVKASDGKLTMTIDGEQKHSHQLTDKTKVTLNGDKSKLEKLEKGDQIEVTTTSNNRVTKIEAVRTEITPQKETASSSEETVGFLGVAIAPSEFGGVFVPQVAVNGPAEKAGIRGGDYIVSINGEKVSSPQELEKHLSKLKPGDEAKIVAWRNGEQHDAVAILTARKTAGYRPNQNATDQSESSSQAESSKPWLGVMLTNTDNESGVKIERVYPGGPAAQAGLKSGDILTKLNDESVSQAKAVSQELASMKPGTDITMIIKRGDNTKEISAKLGDRSDLMAMEGSNATSAAMMGEVPEHFMMLEQHRQFAKQHQRIEDLCLDLLDEVQQLRKEVKALKQEDKSTASSSP